MKTKKSLVCLFAIEDISYKLYAIVNKITDDIASTKKSKDYSLTLVASSR